MERYVRAHSNRTNLAIHLLAVPVFVITLIPCITGLMLGHFALAGLLALGPVLSMAAQGWGHRLETHAPEPFRGPLDVLRRILVEQFLTFPRFVVSGGWLRAWRAGPVS